MAKIIKPLFVTLRFTLWNCIWDVSADVSRGAWCVCLSRRTWWVEERWTKTWRGRRKKSARNTAKWLNVLFLRWGKRIIKYDLNLLIKQDDVDYKNTLFFSDCRCVGWWSCQDISGVWEGGVSHQRSVFSCCLCAKVNEASAHSSTYSALQTK